MAGVGVEVTPATVVRTHVRTTPRYTRPRRPSTPSSTAVEDRALETRPLPEAPRQSRPAPAPPPTAGAPSTPRSPPSAPRWRPPAAPGGSSCSPTRCTPPRWPRRPWAARSARSPTACSSTCAGAPGARPHQRRPPRRHRQGRRRPGPRRRCSRATPEFVRGHTGQVIGGVSPIDHPGARADLPRPRRCATTTRSGPRPATPPRSSPRRTTSCRALTGATEIEVTDSTGRRPLVSHGGRRRRGRARRLRQRRAAGQARPRRHPRRGAAHARRRHRPGRAGRLRLGHRAPTPPRCPRCCATCSASRGARWSASCDLEPVQPMREHRFADGTRLALPSGSRSAQLDAVDDGARRGGPASSGSTTSMTRPRCGTCCGATTSSGPGPRASPRQGGRRPAAQPADDAQGRHPARSRTSGCGRWPGTTRSQGGHDPRNVPGVVRHRGLPRAELRHLDASPAAWARLAALLTKRLGERGVTVMTGDHAPRTSSWGPPGPRACTPAPARSRPTGSSSRSTRARLPGPAPARRPLDAGDPAAVTHVGLAQEVPDMPREIVRARRVRRHRAHRRVGAPAGKAAWTLLGRGKVAEDLVMALARKRIDLRDAVETRLDLTPRQHRRAVVAARRAASCGRAARRSPTGCHRDPAAAGVRRRRPHRRGRAGAVRGADRRGRRRRHRPRLSQLGTCSRRQRRATNHARPVLS